VVDSLDEALTRGPFDAGLLAVKAFDTAALVETLVPYHIALPPILCFQNGVENEPLLEEKLGEDMVIPATVTTAIGRRGPGEIVVERLRGVGVARTHILTPTLVSALDSAGLRARSYENGPAMKWSKMITNLLANASSAILDLPPSAIFPVAVQVPLTGSYSSTRASSPVTSTLPSRSKVASAPSWGPSMFPVSDQVPLAGSYTSADVSFSAGPPPATSTRPSRSRTAIWP
jgi:hypothetical protein